MNYNKWEKRLKKALKPMPKSERARTVEYYREIYGDRLACGMTEDQILLEFGLPEDCAQKILTEQYDEGEGVKLQKAPKTQKNNALRIVVLTLVSLFLVLPLACVAIGVVVSFASVCISGVAIVLGGIVVVIAGPFLVLEGGGIAAVGVGLALAGVGLLLFAGFYLATKYTAIGAYKAFKLIYVRR